MFNTITREQMELKLEQAREHGDYDFIEYWLHRIEKLDEKEGK